MSFDKDGIKKSECFCAVTGYSMLKCDREIQIYDMKF